MIKQFEKRNQNPAIPPSKRNLIEEFKNLGINTKLVIAMKMKFEEKDTSITGNETNDDLPAVMVCDVDEQPGGLMCKTGINGLDLVVTGRGSVYSELGHNHCVTGTGVVNVMRLREECHNQKNANIQKKKDGKTS